MKKETIKDNTKKRDAEKRKKMLVARLIAFAVCLVILAYNFYTNFDNIILSSAEEVAYTDFLAQVDSGDIISITVDSSSGIIIYEKGNDSGIIYQTSYPFSEDFIENMLLKGVDVNLKKERKKIDVLSIISIGTTLFLTYVVVKQLNPSKQKTLPENVEKSKIKFSDIAGMQEIKEDMMSLVTMVTNEEYKKRGAKIPKGILLQGPPGNGKTMLARALAGECGMNFVALNASEFSSPFVGVGSLKIDQTFAEAKKKAPCIIFIDEIDAIGSSRMSAESAAAREYNNILMSLLTQMDGFSSADNVLVLAATNRAEELDPALLRPGRFDRKFTIGYPDKITRKELFELYTKDLTVSENVNVDNFVRQTYGCSSAEIRNIINEAIINSVNNKRENVTEEDFSSALIRSSLDGLVKKTAKWEGKTKDTVAYHEAGHAIVAYFLAGRQITNINIVPTTADAGGFTLIENDDDKITELKDYRNQMAICYGGKAAESVLYGGEENVSVGASADIKRATELAARYVNFKDGVDYSMLGQRGAEIIAEKVKEELEKSYTETVAVIKKYWKETEAVAEALKMKESITGKEFLEIVSAK